MGYDERLADRVRNSLRGRRGVVEKKMFGGLAFLLRGKMFCGVLKDDLVVRVGPERNVEALRKPYARPMDFTGKPMTGYVYVAPPGCGDGKSLFQWLDWAAEFVKTLPAGKRPRPAKKKMKSR